MSNVPVRNGLFCIVSIFSCLLLFTGTATSQTTWPTGDTDLTDANLELLRNRIYTDPQLDGAPAPPRKADISEKDAWKLKIKHQGLQNSCQSYAVAYATDTLERNNYHSSSYIWDLLSYKRVNNNSDPYRANHAQCAASQDACSRCAFGFNVVDALEEARGGMPFEPAYRNNSCGTVRPSFEPGFQERFKYDFIWWDQNKYGSGSNYPLNKFTLDEAVVKIKEKIVNGNPVVVSISAAPFQSHGKGVYYSSLPQAGGWHAMTVVSFDDDKPFGDGDEKGAFKVANSWGPGWGESGYLWISYEAFKRLTRLISFLSVNEDQDKYVWEPVVGTSPDGAAPGDIKPNSRIGIYQMELTQKAQGDVSVCLDANTWYPGQSPHQVILFRCHNQSVIGKYHNQKWEVTFREQRNGNNYYILRSFADAFKNKVLAIRDKKLVLEDEATEFDENQLWLIRLSPLTQKRAIAWAGAGGEFILQGEARNLSEYTYEKAAQASIGLETFNNLPRQTWSFRDRKNSF